MLDLWQRRHQMARNADPASGTGRYLTTVKDSNHSPPSSVVGIDVDGLADDELVAAKQRSSEKINRVSAVREGFQSDIRGRSSLRAIVKDAFNH
jgi:hypothetical protein